MIDRWCLFQRRCDARAWRSVSRVVMRPKAIKGAGALDYYAKLVPAENGAEHWKQGQAAGRGVVEDYYLPLGEAPGEWFGEGAVRFGLAGEGRRDQMAALLDGRDPRDGVLLGQRPRRDGVRAYDLTFSAPKGVSVLAGIVGGETEREVIAAHDAAVKAAVGVLEERATTRAGKNGIHRLDAGGLTTLLVMHRTSRSLDPQLHTHALVFAKVQAADGRWRALDASIVFRAQRLFGAAYQSALRSEMTARLGVEWGEVVKGQAEVAGLDGELLGAFSRRSEQVARAAERRLEVWRGEHPGREPSERSGRS
jgi:conjugative relaxase-like TrwC/TraI family protein